MLDSCTSSWLCANGFIFQYGIVGFYVEVYKNQNSIVVIDKNSVTKFMYPKDYFVNEDETGEIINSLIEEQKKAQKAIERKNSQKRIHIEFS